MSPSGDAIYHLENSRCTHLSVDGLCRVCVFTQLGRGAHLQGAVQQRLFGLEAVHERDRRGSEWMRLRLNPARSWSQTRRCPPPSFGPNSSQPPLCCRCLQGTRIQRRLFSHSSTGPRWPGTSGSTRRPGTRTGPGVRSA